jgi:hypothetical protein
LKKASLLVALGTVTVFTTQAIRDPKEAVDNPHTHQEAPSAPIIDSMEPILSTHTGTVGWLSTLGPEWREFEGSQFRIL